MLLKTGVSLAWSSLSAPRFLCKFALKKLYLCCYLQFYTYNLHLIGKGQKYPFKKIILASGNP